MNSELYCNVGKPWTKEEDYQLKENYVNQQISVLEISRIHKRFPGGICSRIKSLGLVENDFEIRDIDKIKEYLSSETYLNLKKNYKIYKEQNSSSTKSYQKLNENINEKINKLENDLLDLKNIVKELIYEIYKNRK
jgi:hypothetical protein